MRVSKRGIVANYLIWVLMAVAVLAIILLAIFALKDKGFSLVDSIKDLFTGR